MNNDDKIYQSLVSILKTFKNRPYHLAKYLIDNDAFNENFVNKLINSNVIKYSDRSMFFKDITQMNDYFNSLLEDKKDKNLEDLSIELNQKLELLLKEEKYEEAIFIRDFMNKNNIPRINF
jgi:hypothetical protein